MKRLLFFLLFFSSTGHVLAQTLKNKIANSYQRLEDDINIKHGIVSLTVLDANTGEVVFTKNDHLGLATASTLKTITSITAYDILGSDFKYTTELVYSGEIDANGTLHGDIIIKGSGDPSLGSDRFEQSKANVLLTRWISSIKAVGIKKVEGRIIGDDLLFGGNQAPSGWTWEDMGNYYGAGVSSLNWRENTFAIVVNAGSRVGEPTRLVRTEPDVSYLTFINEIKTGHKGSGDQVYAYSAPYSSIISLTGTYGIDLNKKVILSIPDGAYDVALNLQLALQEQQILTSQPATTAYLLQRLGVQPVKAVTPIDLYQSPSLSELCHWFNRISINLYGEALLKTIAIHQNVNSFTDEIAKWERDYWSEKLKIDTGALKIEDGSGLAPENRVSTMAMAKILYYAKRQPWFGSFHENLPTYNGMKMKSGTIGGVLGYAGYQMASDGTPLVFSLLINNYEGSTYAMRRKMFTMLNALK